LQNGKLLGYSDALFIELHIYDVKHKEYTIIENRDGIDSWEIPINRIYTYKDGSTAIVAKGKENIEVEIFQSITIRREVLK